MKVKNLVLMALVATMGLVSCRWCENGYYAQKCDDQTA